MDSNTLLRDALTLPENERIRLVESLLETLCADTDGTEEGFRTELERRSADIDQGQADLIPWDQLKREKD